MTKDNLLEYENLKAQKKKYLELLQAEELNLKKLEKAFESLAEFERGINNHSDEILNDIRNKLSKVSSTKFFNNVYSEINERVKGRHFFEVVSNVLEEKREIKTRIISSENLIQKYQKNINSISLKMKNMN